MKLRGKIAWVFILLMAAAILITIGYSILFIRDHMYRQKEAELSRFVAQSLRSAPADSLRLCMLAAQHGYLSVLVAESGKPLCGDKQLASLLPLLWDARSSAALAETLPDYLWAYRPLPNGQHWWVSLEKEAVLNQLRPIRWIIYHAMFITLGLVALAAIALSVALARPIVRIKKTLEEIARGNPELLARDTRRKDEIGMIARALNNVSANLQRDNARLRELNARQAHFYSDIAHELNNPLHAMQGALEMLRLKGDDAEARERYLAILQNQTFRMANLFKDVLTLQQADHAHTFVQPVPTAIEAIAQKATLPYVEAFAQKGIDWQCTVQPCVVLADPQKLEQVLDNLLSNALKYTSKGRVRLVGVLAGEAYLLSVEDTGAGIAAQHLPHLTDRFYRTDAARARSAGGTGLGLAIVQSLLEAHGSSLEISSTEGQGSCFSFRLPLAKAV